MYNLHVYTIVYGKTNLTVFKGLSLKELKAKEKQLKADSNVWIDFRRVKV